MSKFLVVVPEKGRDAETATEPSLLTLINSLPSEMKQRVAYLLSAHDLINLARASKIIARDLNICIVSSTLGDRIPRCYQTGRAVRCFAAVIPKQEASIHSMMFSCSVSCKGREHATIGIWVVEHDLPENQNPENLQSFRFQSENIVASSVTVERSTDALLTFAIQPNKFYQLFLTTQDRLMYYSNMTLHRVGFGKKSTDYTGYHFDDSCC